MDANVIGAAATFTSFIAFIPSARAVWLNRSDANALAGASVLSNLILCVNAILWAVYAVVDGALWAGVPGLFNLPLFILSIFLIVRARRRASSNPLPG